MKQRCWTFSFTILCTLIGASDAQAANNLPTQTDTYTTEFSDSSGYTGLFYNWGRGGPIQLPLGMGVFARQSLNPQGWTPAGRTISGQVADLPRWGMPNSTALLVGQNGTCQVQRQQHSVANNYPEQDLHGGPGIVMRSIPCSDDSFMFISQLNLKYDDNYDFLVVSIDDMDGAGTIRSAIAYLGKGSNDPPTYVPVDITAALKKNNIAVHAPGQFVAFADANYDGLADLFILTSSGTRQQLLLFYAVDQGNGWGLNDTPVVAISDLGFRTPIASASQIAPFPSSCTSGVSRGPTGVVILDFDGDGVNDAIVVSPSDQNGHFYHGTNSGEFIRRHDIPFSFGGAQFLSIADYDRDFHLDFAAGRGEYSCGSGDVGASILYGQGSTGFFHERPLMLPANSNTLIWTSSPNRYMYDSKGYIYCKSSDVFMGSKGSPMFGTQWFNVPVSDRFNTFGQGWPFPQQKGGQALLKATVQVANSQPSGTSIDMYLSPDGGEHWEPMTPAEMSGQVPHYFYNYGSNLTWLAEFYAPPSTESGSYAQVMPVANVSPSISSVSMSLLGASQQANFTRSNVLGITLGSGNSNKPITLASSYSFPGWSGHLIAYNLQTGDASNTNQVVTTTAQALWDAGNLLQSRSAASRTLYTAYVASSVQNSPNLTVDNLTRLNFTQSEITTPTTPAGVVPLRTALGWPPPFASNMAQGFRGGNNGSNPTGPKMYDTGHGDPVFIAKPQQDANVMGNGYAQWSNQHASRQGAILKSSNAGMLHAFDPNTGSELWGYIPTAQLQRIGDTAVYDLSAYTNYRHHFLVDGPTISGDVYSGGAWHSIAVQGQGYGYSDSNNNFYFALDVTDPSNPQPLWQMTEANNAGQLSCDYNNRCRQLRCTDSLVANANCILQNTTYNSMFNISLNNHDELGRPYGAMQAETVGLLSNAIGNNQGSWSIISSTSSQMGSSAHNNAYLQGGGTSSSCDTSSTQNAQTCARADYLLWVDNNAAGVYYPLVRQWDDSKTHTLALLVDDNLIFSGQPARFSASNNTWRWAATGSSYLSGGMHKFSLVMSDPSIAIDAFALRVSQASAPGTGGTTTAVNNCDQVGSAPSCSNQCLADATQEWPECGVGANNKCCAQNGQSFCTPVGSSCSNPPSSMGQTFSKPALARLRSSSGDVWALFFGSGYNVTQASNVGRSIYAIEAYTGQPLGEWNLPDIANPPSSSIQTVMAGGFTPVDADNDGYVDRIYFGDTAGRLWKLNTQASGNASAINGLSSTYSLCTVFDAGDPNGTGNRIYAPITQRPAVALVAGKYPNIYFGTGSSLGASPTQQYSFYSIRDTDNMNACNNSKKVVGNFQTTNLEWVVTDPTQGYRFWGDPTIIDDAVVYFSSMFGDPDWLVSSDNSSLTSHIYSRAIQSYTDTAGVSHAAMTSTLPNKASYLIARGAVRSALVAAGATGGSTTGTSGANTVARGSQGITGTPATNLYVNNLAGEVMRLSTSGTQPKLNHLRRIAWREIEMQH